MTVGIFELLGDRYELVAIVEGNKIRGLKEGIAEKLKDIGVTDEVSAMRKLGDNFYLLAVQLTKSEG